MSYDLSQLLAAAVPEPPVSLDADVLVRTAQRHRSHRRLLSAAAAGLVAAVVTVTAVLLGQDGTPRRTPVPFGGETPTPDGVTLTVDPAGAALQQRLTARIWRMTDYTAGGRETAVTGHTVLQFGEHGFRISGACEDEVGHVSYSGGRLLMTKAGQTGPDCPADGPDLSVQALDDLASGGVTVDGITGGLRLSGSGIEAHLVVDATPDRDLGVQLAPASLPAPPASSDGIVQDTVPSNVAEGPAIDWDARPNHSSRVSVAKLPGVRGLSFTPVLPHFGVVPNPIYVSTDAAQGAAGGLVDLHYTLTRSAALPVEGNVRVREQPVATAPGGWSSLVDGRVPAGTGTPMQIAGHLTVVAQQQSSLGTYLVITVRGSALITIGGKSLSRAEAIALAGQL